MRPRLAWFLALVCFGCRLVDVGTGTDGAKAQRLGQEGQAALTAGQPEQASAPYEDSRAHDAARTENYLSLAAAYVEKGDDANAAAQLGRFLEGHPEHQTTRVFFAELLLRLKRLPEAQGQFERLIAAAQEERTPDLTHLVHCHGRLLEIAEALEDDYQAHLQRGIGLYVLAQARAQLADPDGEMPLEALLCKAAAELSHARTLRPHEARPCLYLYSAWRQLAQLQLAQRWLCEANRTAPSSYLTPSEHIRLQLASRALPAATRP
jgi:hypothetical protein